VENQGIIDKLYSFVSSKLKLIFEMIFYFMWISRPSVSIGNIYIPNLTIKIPKGFY